MGGRRRERTTRMTDHAIRTAEGPPEQLRHTDRARGQEVAGGRCRSPATQRPDTRSAAEQSLDPAEEPPVRTVGSRLRCCCWRYRRAGSLWLPARSRRLRRPGGGTRPPTRACRSLHLLIVAAQDRIRRRQSGRPLHLLVMPAQNGICRYRAHDRLPVENAAGIVTKKSSSIRGPAGASTLPASTRPEREVDSDPPCIRSWIRYSK